MEICTSHAPHFGSAREIMIKGAKRAVYAILGNADITDEELMTAFTGAEGFLNSRPLTYQSAYPENDVPLTPNHFLFGQVGGQFAPESVDETTFNPKKRWRRVQEPVRHFWHRWIWEWLPALDARRKWLTVERDIQVEWHHEGTCLLVELSKFIQAKMDTWGSPKLKWEKKNSLDLLPSYASLNCLERAQR